MGEPKTIKVRSYKNFQTEHFLKDLKNLDWSYFNHYHDLDEACEKFNENVKPVAEKHAPFVTQRISGRVEAWVTEDLGIAIRERDFLCNKATKTNYPRLRGFQTKKEPCQQIEKSTQMIYNEVLQQQQNRPKQLWKTIKQLVSGKSGS